MDRPSLRQLEYFIVLAEELSFRRAAERCFISQPALSTQIKQLEELLGLALFERSKKQVFLTASGRSLLPKALETIRSVDDLMVQSQSIRDPHSGPLRLGVIPTIAPFLLPTCLDQLQAELPSLEIHLREDQTHMIVSKLWKNELELLLLAREADIGQLEEYELCKDEFVVGLPPQGHRLSKQRTVTIEDLATETILHLEEGHCLGDQARALCSVTGRDQKLDLSGSSLNTIVQMVRCGRGITLLPKMSCTKDHLPGQLKIKMFKRPKPFRTIILAWRPNSPRQAVYQKIGAIFQNAFNA